MKLRMSPLIGLLIVTASRTGHAQLRPLEPTDFGAFHGSALRATLGGAVYDDQRASLAGTEGRLWEIGNVRVQIRTGRVLLDFGGTVQRLFTDESIWAAPTGDAAPPAADRHRHDAGDYRAGVVVALTEHSATLATLRFGTRLPTTDNIVGLDRDATDFFSTLGVCRAFGALTLGAEAGLGINGTRRTTHEQSDVLIYALQAGWRWRSVEPYVFVLGQEDLHPGGIRGNEDLGEARIGLKAGVRRWFDVAFVRGYRDFSPGSGLQLSIGAVFDP